MAAEVESGRMMSAAKIKEWLTLASVVVVVLGGLLGGMKLVVAPLHKDIQAIHGRLDRMNGRLDRMDGRMDRMDGRMDRMESSVAGLREDMAEIRERLSRLETLIERGPNQPGTHQELALASGSVLS